MCSCTRPCSTRNGASVSRSTTITCSGTAHRKYSSTASCTRPFVESALPPSMRASPRRSVNRPPASSTMTCTGGHVPDRDLRLDRDLDRPFGDEHVRPEVAEAARACAAARQREKAHRAAVLVEVADAVVGEMRVFERGDARRRASARDAEGVQNAPSPADAHQRRAIAGAETTPATTRPFSSSADERGEDRDAADVVLRAVDRIDDPAPRADAGRAEFLADDAVLRALRAEALADHPLHRFIGLGDRRHVDLRAHGQRGRLIVTHRDDVGRVGHRQRELEVGIHAGGDYYRPNVSRRPNV